MQRLWDPGGWGGTLVSHPSWINNVWIPAKKHYLKNLGRGNVYWAPLLEVEFSILQECSTCVYMHLNTHMYPHTQELCTYAYIHTQKNTCHSQKSWPKFQGCKGRKVESGSPTHINCKHSTLSHSSSQTTCPTPHFPVQDTLGPPIWCLCPFSVADLPLRMCCMYHCDRKTRRTQVTYTELPRQGADPQIHEVSSVLVMT